MGLAAGLQARQIALTGPIVEESRWRGSAVALGVGLSRSKGRAAPCGAAAPHSETARSTVWYGSTALRNGAQHRVDNARRSTAAREGRENHEVQTGLHLGDASSDADDRRGMGLSDAFRRDHGPGVHGDGWVGWWLRDEEQIIQASPDGTVYEIFDLRAARPAVPSIEQVMLASWRRRYRVPPPWGATLLEGQPATPR